MIGKTRFYCWNKVLRFQCCLNDYSIQTKVRLQSTIHGRMAYRRNRLVYWRCTESNTHIYLCCTLGGNFETHYSICFQLDYKSLTFVCTVLIKNYCLHRLFRNQKGKIYLLDLKIMCPTKHRMRYVKGFKSFALNHCLNILWSLSVNKYCSKLTHIFKLWQIETLRKSIFRSVKIILATLHHYMMKL